MALPSERFDRSIRQKLIDNCQAEVTGIKKLTTEAGVTLALARDGKKIARLELDSPKLSVPLKLDVTALMADLLPDSPSWYNVSSSVAHSYFWGLRDAVLPSGPGPMGIAPNILEVGAAAQTAISASALIATRCAVYYGHDYRPYANGAKKRRERLDYYMKRFAESPKIWLNSE
jgi:hypothetical protein